MSLMPPPKNSGAPHSSVTICASAWHSTPPHGGTPWPPPPVLWSFCGAGKRGPAKKPPPQRFFGGRVFVPVANFGHGVRTALLSHMGSAPGGGPFPADRARGNAPRMPDRIGAPNE